MNALFKAIYAYFIAEPHNDFYTAIDGRLYYGEAPQDCSLPYSVFFGVTSIPEDTFQEEIDNISIQFNNYSELSSPIEAGELQEKCRNLFDRATLEIVGSKDIKLIREFSTPPWKNDETWITSIEFNTLIQEG